MSDFCKQVSETERDHFRAGVTQLHATSAKSLVIKHGTASIYPLSLCRHSEQSQVLPVQRMYLSVLPAQKSPLENTLISL